MTKLSDAQIRATKKYRSTKRKQIQLDYSFEEYENIRMYCQKKGIPMATWVKLLIAREMRDDNLEKCPQNNE